jgi:hypothetical protein
LLAGGVYDTVTISPEKTAAESLRVTFVPDNETEVTVLAIELTITEKEDAAGLDLLDNARLYVMTREDGAEFSITELT